MSQHKTKRRRVRVNPLPLTDNTVQMVEALAEQLPVINGVPVAKALTYELVQIINQLEAQQ